MLELRRMLGGLQQGDIVETLHDWISEDDEMSARSIV
jgi:hypothetical protein